MVAPANQRVNALDSFGKRITSKNPLTAIRQGGGHFGLKKVPLSEWSGQPSNTDLHVIVRTDTNTAIGQVGNSYECFDNEQFFVPVAEALINEGAQIDRFSMLGGGTRSFMKLSWPDDDFRVGNAKVGDVVGRRTILSTSHDGKYGGKLVTYMMRLVCSNGQTIPVGQCEQTLTHSKGGHQQLVDLTKMVPRIVIYSRQFETAANILAETRILPTDSRTRDIVTRIVDPEKKAGETKAGEDNQAALRINRVMDLFAGGQPAADNRAVKNTGWGLFQAVADFYTHGFEDQRHAAGESDFRALLPGRNAGTRSTKIFNAWNVVTDGLGVTDQLQEAVAAVN